MSGGVCSDRLPDSLRARWRSAWRILATLRDGPYRILPVIGRTRRYQTNREGGLRALIACADSKPQRVRKLLPAQAPRGVRYARDYDLSRIRGPQPNAPRGTYRALPHETCGSCANRPPNDAGGYVALCQISRISAMR